VAELERRDRGILGFDVGERRDPAGMNADDIAEEPFQHIDVVAGLVGQPSQAQVPRQSSRS
jgi:hypothetical protein